MKGKTFLLSMKPYVYDMSNIKQAFETIIFVFGLECIAFNSPFDSFKISKYTVLHIHNRHISVMLSPLEKEYYAIVSYRLFVLQPLTLRRLKPRKHSASARSGVHTLLHCDEGSWIFKILIVAYRYGPQSYYAIKDFLNSHLLTAIDVSMLVDCVCVCVCVCWGMGVGEVGGGLST